MFKFFQGAVVALLLMSAGFFMFEVLANTGTPHSEGPSYLAVGGLLLASIATFSGVYFGWRKDRREAQLLKMQIEKLHAERPPQDSTGL